MINQIICGDALTVLKTFPDQAVNCCVTSPPYWGLRDYGISGQLGLESTPEEYVAKMVEVFREVKRVLRKDGILWLNLGDSYARNPSKGIKIQSGDTTYLTNRQAEEENMGPEIPFGLKPKNLVGIPWRVAFALQADGWWLRSDIIWAKPNPMPESVMDRPTKAHEYLFLLSKSPRYYYDSDAIKEPAAESSIKRLSQDLEAQKGSSRGHGGNKTMKAVCFGGNKKSGGTTYSSKEWIPSMAGGALGIENRKHGAYIMVNKRTVWTIPTEPFPEAHFATFPQKLVEPCILAGCPVGGTVLDPFMGSGTVALVALRYSRNYLGIELNPKYIKIAEKRLSKIQISLSI